MTRMLQSSIPHVDAEGSFGSLSRALNITCALNLILTCVAIKEIKCNVNGISPMVLREITILQQHSNIVHLEGVVMGHLTNCIFEIQSTDCDGKNICKGYVKPKGMSTPTTDMPEF